MTLEEALDEAIRVFFAEDESDDLEFYADNPDGNKYTKKYFDEVESEFLTAPETKPSKRKMGVM